MECLELKILSLSRSRTLQEDLISINMDFAVFTTITHQKGHEKKRQPYVSPSTPVCG